MEAITQRFSYYYDATYYFYTMLDNSILTIINELLCIFNQLIFGRYAASTASISASLLLNQLRVIGYHAIMQTR